MRLRILKHNDGNTTRPSPYGHDYEIHELVLLFIAFGIAGTFKTFDDSAGSNTKEILRGLPLQAVSCERGVCKARLKVAQAQVTRIEVEETTMLAKKTFFEKEAQGLRDMLEVY